ncbi:MAG: hypothetical protein BGO67_01815 [Alphaproteobacteria bacterium 41-28]|nr:MAG: hypothetical protein BGO67_01815 [Alphaproteobacteria bacterium 41-28]
MNQAIKILFFLLCVGPQLSFSCQSMEKKEEDEELQPHNFSWSRSLHNLKRYLEPSSFPVKPTARKRGSTVGGKESKKTVYPESRKSPDVGREPKKNESSPSTLPRSAPPALFDTSITYSIEDIIKFFDDEKTLINPYHRAYVMRRLTSITPEEKRSSVFVKAQSFLLAEMDGFDFAFLLHVISHLSKENEDFFSVAPLQPLTPEERSNRLHLLEVFYKIPPVEWNTLVAFVQKNKFFPDTGAQVRDTALNLIFTYRLSKIPRSFRNLFFEYITKAIPESYSLHYCLELDENIFKNIDEISSSDFQKILEDFSNLSPFSPESTARESFALIEVLCRIPFKGLGCVLRNAKHLIENRKNMPHRGDIIQTLSFIPERMKVEPSEIDDNTPFGQMTSLIANQALSLITPYMDGTDISKVINALDGFLITHEEQDEFNPESEFRIIGFTEFVKTELKQIRENITDGKVDSQIIYAASIMPYEKRKNFSEHFNKFSPPFQRVSLEEIFHRFLYLSRVPPGHESNAVALLNKAVQGMSEKERLKVTKIASVLVGTELKNFTLLVSRLEEQSFPRFYRPLIIDVFSEIGSIQRKKFAERPFEKFFNKSFIPPFDEVSPTEIYLRSLFLSRIPEDKEEEVISILNDTFKGIESHGRESILEKALTFPSSNLKDLEELVRAERHTTSYE